MKSRIVVFSTVFCLLFCGCHPAKTAPPAAAKNFPPARSLLVVPFDEIGAQAFLILRIDESGNVAISTYPRETVFTESADSATLCALFANGGAVGVSAIFSAFAENGIPVDRILSVRVDKPDTGLYTLLAQTGNNLLFTNPPAFVYTEGNAKKTADKTALSATALRRVLTASEAVDSLAYATFRAQTTCAVVAAVATAFRDESDALFSLLCSVGHSTFTAADHATFSALFSPAPQIRLCPVRGDFVGAGIHVRFYPRAP